MYFVEMFTTKGVRVYVAIGTGSTMAAAQWVGSNFCTRRGLVAPKWVVVGDGEAISQPFVFNDQQVFLQIRNQFEESFDRG
ncbi:MAG TPA: hypothetical protein PKD55_00130 [Bellilinea sp.]|nr:hypothetical protein [Bellilinea sp.]